MYREGGAQECTKEGTAEDASSHVEVAVERGRVRESCAEVGVERG